MKQTYTINISSALAQTELNIIQFSLHAQILFHQWLEKKKYLYMSTRHGKAQANKNYMYKCENVITKAKKKTPNSKRYHV